MPVPRINRTGLNTADRIPHPIHIQSNLRHIRRPVAVQDHRHMMPLTVIHCFCPIDPAILNLGPDRSARINPNHPFAARFQRAPTHNLPAGPRCLDPRHARPRPRPGDPLESRNRHIIIFSVQQKRPPDNTVDPRLAAGVIGQLARVPPQAVGYICPRSLVQCPVRHRLVPHRIRRFGRHVFIDGTVQRRDRQVIQGNIVHPHIIQQPAERLLL